MTFALARNWWSLVIRGILGIVIGLITFMWPGITLMAMVFLFAAYALVDGVVSLFGAAHAAQAHERWAVLLIEGLLGIVAAVITVLWPASLRSLCIRDRAWAILTGVAELRVCRSWLRRGAASQALSGEACSLPRVSPP